MRPRLAAVGGRSGHAPFVAAGRRGYTPRAMDIGFWPHIWAIPLTVLVGIGIGWFLRAQMDDDD